MDLTKTFKTYKAARGYLVYLSKWYTGRSFRCEVVGTQWVVSQA